MYINDVRIGFRKIINGIELFLGIAGFIIFGSTNIYATLEGGANKEVTNIFLVVTVISVLLIIRSLYSRKFIGSVFFYSRYFEGD